MIKVENIEVFNFEGAMRGMRNPLQSHSKSDSWFDSDNPRRFELGENDLDLMRRLYKAGSEHRKFARSIFVSMDVTAPEFWWRQFDTYKIGTTENSKSFMHKGMSKEFELCDFGIELKESNSKDAFDDTCKLLINQLNTLRDLYLNENDVEKKEGIWRKILFLLPQSYLYTRTITLNYENVFNMIRQRNNHKLLEWREFCGTLKELPYIKKIMSN
mgnify:CR=1 FL=1